MREKIPTKEKIEEMSEEEQMSLHHYFLGKKEIERGKLYWILAALFFFIAYMILGSISSFLNLGLAFWMAFLGSKYMRKGDALIRKSEETPI